MNGLPQALVISHDVVGSRMAGPGIRYWELARALAGQQQVTLLAPAPIDLAAPGVRCASYDRADQGALDPWLATADVVVANGHMLATHPALAATSLPLALDLYDPTPLEDLELLRGETPELREQQAARDAALLRLQLARGDCLLCATERQRDLYLGALMSLGRLRPALTDADPLLRRLLVVAPFGLPAEPPPPRQPAMRGVLPGVDAGSLLVLWSGGLWDWLDPLTLIRAVALLAPELPTLRLVFLAGAHPGLARPSTMVEEARRLAAELGLLGTTVLFYDQWVPYERRGDFLGEADLLASLHGEHLESAYAAVRSRFLDHLWVGRASLVSAGDAAAALVEQHGLGRTVPPGDAAATAEALRLLLGNGVERAAAATRAAALAAEYTWARTLAPLLEFCGSPYTMTDRHDTLPAASADTPLAAEAPTISLGDVLAANDARNQALGSLDALWSVAPPVPTSGLPVLGQAKQALGSLTRWYIEGVVAQQNAFNAALVRALQQVANADDLRHSSVAGSASDAHGRVDEVLASLRNVHDFVVSTQRQLANQNEWMANVNANLQALQRQFNGIEEQLATIRQEAAPLHQHVADMEQHLLDIDDAQTMLALQNAKAQNAKRQAPNSKPKAAKRQVPTANNATQPETAAVPATTLDSAPPTVIAPPLDAPADTPPAARRKRRSRKNDS